MINSFLGEPPAPFARGSEQSRWVCEWVRQPWRTETMSSSPQALFCFDYQHKIWRILAFQKVTTSKYLAFFFCSIHDSWKISDFSVHQLFNCSYRVLLWWLFMSCWYFYFTSCCPSSKLKLCEAGNLISMSHKGLANWTIQPEPSDK